MISICSQQCNYSMKRQRFYCFISFAQNADIHMSGKRAKLYDWPKNGKTITCTKDNSVLHVVSRLIFQQQVVFNNKINGSVQLFQKIGNIIRSSNDLKWQACMRETDADRSWQAGHGEPWTSKRDEQGRSNARAFLFGDSPSHFILRTWRRMCSHIPLKERSQIRKVRLQKWRHKKRKHSVHAYFRKNEKRSILRSEKYGDLTTAEHKILSEGYASRNNHRHAVVVQVLASQWNPCKTQHFTGDGEEFTKAYRNRRRNQKLFIRTIC